MQKQNLYTALLIGFVSVVGVSMWFTENRNKTHAIDDLKAAQKRALQVEKPEPLPVTKPVAKAKVILPAPSLIGKWCDHFNSKTKDDDFTIELYHINKNKYEIRTPITGFTNSVHLDDAKYVDDEDISGLYYKMWGSDVNRPGFAGGS